MHTLGPAAALAAEEAHLLTALEALRRAIPLEDDSDRKARLTEAASVLALTRTSIVMRMVNLKVQIITTPAPQEV